MWAPILYNLALRRISRNVISSLALHIPTPPSRPTGPIIKVQESMYADNVVALTKSNEDAHAFLHGREVDLKCPGLVAGLAALSQVANEAKLEAFTTLRPWDPKGCQAGWSRPSGDGHDNPGNQTRRPPRRHPRGAT